MPQTPPNINPGDWGPLNQYLSGASDLNFQAFGWSSCTWNLMAGGGAGATAPSTQTIFATGMYMGGGQIINNIWLHSTVASAGTAPTGMFLGICDTAVMRAQTANVTGATAVALGLNKYALSAPFTVPTTGLYYGVLLVNGTWGSTQPTVTRGFNLSGAGQIPSGNFLWSQLGTGQTALPANAAAVTHAATALNFWFAVS